MPQPPYPPPDSPVPAVLDEPDSWELQLLCWLAEYGRRKVLRVWRGVLAEQRKQQQLPVDVAAQPLAKSLHRQASVGQLVDKFPQSPKSMAALAVQLKHQQTKVAWFAQLPSRLQAIPDAPVAIYVRGDESCWYSPAVAVVGARRCSATGASFAEQLAQRLAGAGLVVVSGLALGIDGAAHRGANLAGRTVAVLGSGLLNLYPRVHERLAAEILEKGGMLISEYSPSYPSYPGANFPERNRLISGIAQGVVVIEAGLRSGSLITARLALEQGRDVLAVPGSVASPVSAGCHRLLKEGAALVTDVNDVFSALGITPEQSAPTSTPLSPDKLSVEAQVFALLHVEPTSLEQLSAASGLNVPELLAALTRLELSGFVQRLPQGYIPSPR